MITDIFFNIANNLRIQAYKLFGGKLTKFCLNIAEQYYKLTGNGVVHEDAISQIIKLNYDSNDKIENCRYFIYSKKTTIDSIFNSKYGKSGRFMSHLFKLIQRVYLDSIPDHDKRSFDEEVNTSTISLNKVFNKVVLFMYAKYNG
ncbi:hypothetical protein MASR1M45_27850 [Candidatus Kapaibacterium sp.]